MKKLFVFIIVLQFLTPISAQSLQNQNNLALRDIDRRGEVYFNFKLLDKSKLAVLTQKISIDKIRDDSVYAYANQKEFSEFLKHGFNYTVLTAPSELFPVEMTNDTKLVLSWNYYPTYPAYEALMQQFATNYPSICKLVTIATLQSGRKILALRISDNINIEEDEPEFFYSSSIHGDETTGYILLLHLADYLLTGYGNDDRLTKLVNNTDLLICPLSNPDGTYKGGDNLVNGATRGNSNNIDLNRNFPDPRTGNHPDGNAWQPETEAFMKLAEQNHLTMAANFHGGAEVVNYPWDTWSKLTADNTWWKFVCREYADTVHANSPVSYLNGFDKGITNGFAWYEVQGGRQDYMNYFYNCREATIELSDVKLLPASMLLSHWNYNYKSLINFIEQAGYGLHGKITDSVTGTSVYAKVEIQGFDMDNSFVFTDSQVGDYHRLLKAGKYWVTFSASGYVSKTFSVTITDKQTTFLNVQLNKEKLIPHFKADTTLAYIDQPIQYTDQSEGSPTKWTWTFEGGNPFVTTDRNPLVQYSDPGIYSVKLVITKAGQSDSLIREHFIEVKPWYRMSTKTYTVCEAQFFDSGGQFANYSENENRTITFYPVRASDKLTAVFNSVNIENSGVNCSTDKLKVFDGISKNGTPVAIICGNTAPKIIKALNSSGALTFQFESNASISLSGWDITLTCATNVALDKEIENGLRIYPNPANSGFVIVEAAQPIEAILVMDATGKKIAEVSPTTNRSILPCFWKAGFYFIQIQIKDKLFIRKLQIIN